MAVTSVQGEAGPHPGNAIGGIGAASSGSGVSRDAARGRGVNPAESPAGIL